MSRRYKEVIDKILEPQNFDRIPYVLAHAVSDYVCEVAEAINLREWIVFAVDDPPAEGHFAEIKYIDCSKYANVYLSDGFIDPANAELNDYLRTQILIHEVMHLHFKEAADFVEARFKAHLPRHAFEISSEVLEDKVEIAIDQLAWAFLNFLPHFEYPALDIKPLSMVFSSND